MPVQNSIVRREFYKAKGLLQPGERDACGFGLIVSTRGPSPEVIQSALTALSNMGHRGVKFADGKTGDGAGIRLQLPRNFVSFINRKSQEESFRVPAAIAKSEHVAVGQFFFNQQNASKHERLKAIAEARVREYLVEKGFDKNDFLWRQVPTDLNYLGPQAQKNQPAFEQLVLPHGTIDAAGERDLYILRQRIEHDWRKASYNQASSNDAYISSLSADSIVYKGMPLAENIANLHSDLKDPVFNGSAWALVHQRMSTNTASTADKAHPYRFVVHNGEINTLTANKIYFAGRMKRFITALTGKKNDGSIDNVIQPGGSDTAAFDNATELLVRTGLSLPTALSVMVPGAYGINDANQQTILTAARDISSPWDGPVAMAAVDGDHAVVLRDRNGLRPVRGLETKSGLIIFGSEIGMVPVEPQNIARYLPIGPGEKYAVDLKAENAPLLGPAEVEAFAARELVSVAEKVAAREQNFSFTLALPQPAAFTPDEQKALFLQQVKAHYTEEAIDRVLKPILNVGKEPSWSMGDDGQIAVFAEKRALDFFYDMMRQSFAQVTNPAVDSVNERGGMVTIDANGKASLNMPIGNLGPPLASPILFSNELASLEKAHAAEFTRLNATYDSHGREALKNAILQLQQDAERQVEQGKTQIILSHANSGEDQLAIPMPLAVSAVHSHLVKKGLRDGVAIHAHTQEMIETHKTAMLIASGANFVTPYLVEQTIAQIVQSGEKSDLTADKAFGHYREAMNDGFLKIIGKMGISVPSAFWGQFSLLGMDRKEGEEFFPWTESPISGLTLRQVQERQKKHAEVADRVIENAEISGIYRRAEGTALTYLKAVTGLDEELYEMHIWRPNVIDALQKAAISGSASDYKAFTAAQKEGRGENPVSVRDFLKIRRAPNGGISKDHVAGISDVLDHFTAPGISLGAIAPWVHRDIAQAMKNLRAESITGIGPKSNSGEGGEDIVDRRMEATSSTIKQVASGRFGVDALYLRDAEIIEIKVAQGAKAGEGGALPGVKVEGIVAKLRHTTPGVGLISPPPHHDIYSIEDLTQLISDLKAVNPSARVRVKLVSQPGIGQIAVGVAKARADEIHIAGHSGGTGSAPLSSIKYTGNPAEIGLAEVQQALLANGLRDNIRLVADGSVISALDVIKLTALGADEVGIGTASLVALGCVMTHQCHKNTCPAGVATQDEKLKVNYHGKPEYLENYYRLLAGEVQEYLAGMGLKSLNELVGRSDLLIQDQRKSAKYGINLSRLLAMADEDRGHANGAKLEQGKRNEPPATLDEKLGAEKIVSRMLKGEKITLDTPINATNLSTGAHFAGEIVKQFILSAIDSCRQGLPRDEEGKIDPAALDEAKKNFKIQYPEPGALKINFTGNAGQSFGAFTTEGMELNLKGAANDYVGKGMSGGKLIVRPHEDSVMAKATGEHKIAGNTLLYGATGGEAFIAGQVDERFMVRGSGARAVVEGCGNYGCEYMSGGVAVVLGKTGEFFASGMKGGLAFVHDNDNTAISRINKADVRLTTLADTNFEAPLKLLIEKHRDETRSTKAADILDNWETEKTKFRVVVPNDIAKLAERPKDFRVDMTAFFEGRPAATKLFTLVAA